MPAFPVQKNLSNYIDEILNGTEAQKAALRQTFFKIAETATHLQSLGLCGKRFVVRYGVISHHRGKDADHQYTADEWKRICEIINEPLLVTKYNGGFNMYLAVTKNGKPTMVGVEPKQIGKNLVVNNVRTVFARNVKAHEEVVWAKK